MGWRIIAIFVLLICNGFFAAAEIAFINIRRTKIQQLLLEGNPIAKLLEQFHQDPNRFLATIQIGITLVGALTSAIGAVTAIKILQPWLESIGVAASLSGPISVGISVILITYLSLVIGELVPKRLAIAYAEKIAFIAAKPIYLLSRVTDFAVRILSKSTEAVLALLRVTKAKETPFLSARLSEEEIKFLISASEEAGVLEKHEEEMIHSILEFSDTQVKEVMVPRTNIIGVDINTDEETLLRIAVESGYSRMPVYKGNLDNIIGILYIKDFLAHLEDRKLIILSDLIRPPYFVPEYMKISELLREFQKRKMHMAIVVDEYGVVTGLVTLEDLLEEIVGEIQDEYDTDETRVQRQKDGSLIIDASMSVNDLKEYYGLRFPESNEFESLSGFILSMLGKIPTGGETVTYDNQLFTVVDVEKQRVKKVKVTLLSHKERNKN